MTQPKFTINYILPNLAHQKDTFIDDYFDTGIKEQEWHISKALERKLEGKSYTHDDIYIKSIEGTIKLLKETKAVASVETQGSDLHFKFAILADSKNFDELNESGARPWLRQHLDDMFHSTTRTAILQQSFDYKNEGNPENAKKFREIHDAFTLALENAYELKTPTFWIDGEVSSDYNNNDELNLG